jgi:hypothetical protein
MLDCFLKNKNLRNFKVSLQEGCENLSVLEKAHDKALSLVRMKFFLPVEYTIFLAPLFIIFK